MMCLYFHHKIHANFYEKNMYFFTKMLLTKYNFSDIICAWFVTYIFF